MKIESAYTRSAKSCRPEENLGEVVGQMWRHDLGLLPVVDADHRVVGVITDRDICIAAATRPPRLPDIRVLDVITGFVVTCRPEDGLRDALQLMVQNGLRRLPVVDHNARLLGILTLGDIALNVRIKGTRATDVTPEDFVLAYRTICMPYGAEPAGRPRKAVSV